MDTNGRVAVIIVDTNEGGFLPKTLDLLATQTRPPDRTIVVDNASTDGSPEMIEERYPHVEVVRLGRNAGFAGANNEGARRADDCDWVVLLNADAFPEPEWLESLLRAAGERPEFAFFASRMMKARVPSELDGAGDAYHVNGLSFRIGHGCKAAEAPYAFESRETFSACGGAVMYRADLYREMGGFDESFFGYLEDTDLAFRLRLAGHRCLYVPDAAVHHVGSGTTGVESEYTLYHSHRNLVWTWVKNMPGPLALLYLPQHLLVNLLTVLWFSSRGRGRTMLRAKRDALQGLPRVLAQRRELQAGRRVSARALRRAMTTGFGMYATAARRAAAQLRAGGRAGG